MRSRRAFSGLSKAALVAALSGFGAACSSDVARFNEPFSNPFRSEQASRPTPQVVAAAPVTRVETRSLDEVSVSRANRPVAVPVASPESSPFGPAPDAGVTTGSIADPALRATGTATPAVRNMAMGRTLGDNAGPVRSGWTPVGGTTIRAAEGDTVESLSRRFGVPASAIGQANGFSPGQSLSTGQAVVIPTYSLAQTPNRSTPAPTREGRPAEQRVAAVSAQSPAAPAAPRPSIDQAASVPVPPSRMAWNRGAEAVAQPAEPRRPATHTVAMGESLASIAARHGMSRQDLARANNLSLDRPIQVGQVLRLTTTPASAPASTSAQPPRAVAATPVPQRTAAAETRDQASRSVTEAQRSPTGRTADRVQTGSISPNAQRIAEPPAASEQAARPAPAPAQQARPAPAQEPPATEEPARPTQAENAQPQFRWPVRGRVVGNFRPGTVDGIRVAVPEGTPVKAAEDGVVAYAGNELRGYGNLVLVRHANGFVTAYAHNSELTVRRGEQVRRGQTIAKAGQTGNVPSPQVHFEIRRGATPVDPMTFLGAN